MVAVLLAGGLARRMGGGDKCLRQIAGRSLLSRVIERIGPQVDRLILNAGGDPERFAAYDLPVVPDVVPGFAGPLAGVLTGLEWVRGHAPRAGSIVTVPTDTPFLPHDLVERLRRAVSDDEAELACASTNGRTHPVVGLWPVGVADDLRRAIIDEGVRKIDLWTARYKLAVVEWDADPIDPFFNVNREQDLAAAWSLMEMVDHNPG